MQLFSDFCDSIDIAAAIIDLDGNVLAGTHWYRCCVEFHRANKNSCANCLESDPNSR